MIHAGTSLKEPERQSLGDFIEFCSHLNLKAVVTHSSDHQRSPSREKEIYAVAILRAVKQGDFGRDEDFLHEAISDLWDYGHNQGFSVDSFNAVFAKYFRGW